MKYLKNFFKYIWIAVLILLSYGLLIAPFALTMWKQNALFLILNVITIPAMITIIQYMVDKTEE